MIDFEELTRAWTEDRFYSLQLEVGDICRQGCIYCYMNALPESINSLTDKTIYGILHDAVRLKITAVEWLGGEPLLRALPERAGIFSSVNDSSRPTMMSPAYTGTIQVSWMERTSL